MLYDMHCHLDFATDAARIARQAAGCIAAMSATVSPDAYERAVRALDAPGIRVGLGLHPWQAAGPGFASAADRFAALAPRCAFIGEVGLDFSARHAATREAQQRAFDRVVRACAAPRVFGEGEPEGAASCDGGPEGGASCDGEPEGGAGRAAPACGMVSIHAVRAVDEAVDAFARADVLEGASRHAPARVAGRVLVLHSFNGTSDQLNRALDAGFFFSAGPRMLATKRGRAYVRALPADRLLVETDAPAREGEPFSFDAWHDGVKAAVEALAAARGQDPHALRERLAETSARILGL